MRDLVAEADESLDDSSVGAQEIEKALGLLSLATRGLELGDEALPRTARGEPNVEERLRTLKSMTTTERVTYRAGGRVLPVLLARRRAAELMRLNADDQLARRAHELLTEVARALLEQLQ